MSDGMFFTSGDSTEYGVVKNSNLFYLVQEINKRIKHGWAPIGGVHTYIDDKNTMYFLQTLTKLKK